MTLTDRQCAHTQRMAELIIYARSAGLSVKVTEWNRLFSTQQEYVAKGVSKTLNSMHLENCATDLYIIKDGKPTENPEDYRVLGVYFENRGGRWGGRFGVKPEEQATKIGWDPVHFETPNA